MIEIISEPRKGLKISGHAGYAEKGKDIVCAGVSVLYQTLIALPGMAYSMDGDDKRAWIIGSGDHLKQWLETFADALETIAEKYPDHVRFRRGSVAKISEDNHI